MTCQNTKLFAIIALSLFTLTSLKVVDSVSKSLSQKNQSILGISSVQPQPGICEALSSLQLNYCKTTPTITPVPTGIGNTNQTNNLTVNNSYCSNNNDVGFGITGGVNINTPNTGYWITITDSKTNQTIIYNFTSTITGYNEIRLFPLYYVSDIRNNTNMTLYGDGRKYFFKVYEAPYTSSTPVLTNLLASVSSYKICENTPIPTPANTSVNWFIPNNVMFSASTFSLSLNNKTYYGNPDPTTTSRFGAQYLADYGKILDAQWTENGDLVTFKVTFASDSIYWWVSQIEASAGIGSSVSYFSNNNVLNVKKSFSQGLDVNGFTKFNGYYGSNPNLEVTNLLIKNYLIKPTSYPSPQPIPTGNTTNVIPGKIEAENYSLITNASKQDTTDIGGGKALAFIKQAATFNYKVNVTTPGLYQIKYRIATPNSGTSLSYIDPTNHSINPTNIPKTGGWQIWSTIKGPTIQLSSGINTLHFSAQYPNSNQFAFNFNWFEANLLVGITTP